MAANAKIKGAQILVVSTKSPTCCHFLLKIMTPLLAIILLVFSIGFLMAMGLEKLWLVIGFFIALIAYLHFFGGI
ncbi:MAG: hypothetical protein RLZZ102_775 [Pseudomonadota bacterium]